MKISVLGFGHVGAQLAKLWSAAGHSLVVGLRRGSKHEEEASRLKTEVLEPRAAAQAGDVIVLALPWTAVHETLLAIGPLAGKIVLDATNPLDAELRVRIPEAGSGGEQVAVWSPGAKVVKAFNTIGAAYQGDAHFDGFYCGDDTEAKKVIAGLIEDTSMRPVDVGPLKNAAYLEHMAGLWIDLAVHNRVQGAFGFNLVKKD